jgi:hypothetical protein
VPNPCTHQERFAQAKRDEEVPQLQTHCKTMFMHEFIKPCVEMTPRNKQTTQTAGAAQISRAQAAQKLGMSIADYLDYS